MRPSDLQNILEAQLEILRTFTTLIEQGRKKESEQFDKIVETIDNCAELMKTVTERLVRIEERVDHLEEEAF